jgi:hypothetical protein
MPEVWWMAHMRANPFIVHAKTHHMVILRHKAHAVFRAERHARMQGRGAAVLQCWERRARGTGAGGHEHMRVGAVLGSVLRDVSHHRYAKHERNCALRGRKGASARDDTRGVISGSVRHGTMLGLGEKHRNNFQLERTAVTVT